MDKKINISTVIIVILSITVIGLLVWGNSKNKTGGLTAVKPAVDAHGHPLTANISDAPLQDLINKPSPDFTLIDRDGKQYSLNELRGKNIVLFF